MKFMKKCPACNSETIIKNVYMLESDHYEDRNVKLAVDESPHAWLNKERSYSGVKTYVCADCGLLQQYAIQPKILLNAFQNQQKNLQSEED